MKKIFVKPIMSVEESDKFQGKMLDESFIKQLYSEDVDVFDKDTGQCLAKFRKKVIPEAVQAEAYKNLLIAAKASSNRATAGGSKSKPRILKSGKISNTTEGENVNSGIVGYFDRNPRFPNCRLTAFNQQHLDKFKKAYPIIKFVDSKYKELMPEEYKRQRKVVDKSSKDFVIRDTAFSTVTVNKNYVTAVHKDSGDFKGGFGNLVALRKGHFDGCYFTLVRWGVAFDLQNGDLLLTDVHQWHGNTPMRNASKDAVRLSLVMYLREHISDCGTMEEELRRVQNRKAGDKLIYGKD